MKPREWWIWSEYDIDQDDFFIHGLFAKRNMWERDNPKVVHVVEYEPMRMEVIKLECEIARLTHLLIKYADPSRMEIKDSSPVASNPSDSEIAGPRE